jgi:hypothetical protein
MPKTACSTMAAIGLAVALGGTGPAAFSPGAGHPPIIRVTVRIDDRAGVPTHILAEAKREATRVFRNIHVEIVWLEQNCAPLANVSASGSVIVMRLVTREMTDRTHTPEPVLGFAAGTSFATVFYNHLEDFWQDLSPTRDASDIACLLGHVIAHEIGHLLLPRTAHSRSGIMQAGLNVQLAGRGALFFSADQARLIRTRLSVP